MGGYLVYITQLYFTVHPDTTGRPCINEGESVEIFISVSGTKLNLYWQESNDGGISWYSIFDGGTSPQYAGTENDTLILTNIPVSHHNYRYRCYIDNTCGQAITDNSLICILPETPSTNSCSNITTSSFTASWTSTPTADYYTLYVDDDSDFSSPLSNYNGIQIEDNETVIDGLYSATSYYYYVKAVNSCGVSANSNTGSCTTACGGTFIDSRDSHEYG
ncbi:MAG: fibronectin type III domain-containing protein, partial [Bacteroidetes bacterium]|nr:fibronectin type III domain-containing protein [Bacteroidota bacterium]